VASVSITVPDGGLPMPLSVVKKRELTLFFTTTTATFGLRRTTHTITPNSNTVKKNTHGAQTFAQLKKNALTAS